MRRFTLALIPVIVLAGSFARAQDYSLRVAPASPRWVTTNWASGATPAGTPIPAPLPATPTIVTTGAMVVSPAPEGGCGGSCGGAACGGTCASCGDCDGGCCLAHVKAWLCSRPLHTCKKVCYTPIPPLYLFFPPVRPGYCPHLAPPMPCPCWGHITHVVCPRCKKSCGCSKASSGDCGACSSCASADTSNPWFKGFRRSSGCGTSSCSP